MVYIIKHRSIEDADANSTSQCQSLHSLTLHECAGVIPPAEREKINARRGIEEQSI